MRECSPSQNMSHVTCHVSHVVCHMSLFTCHMSHFFPDKVVKLIGGGSVFKGALRLQEFPRASPSGISSGKGVYSTLYPSSRPHADTVNHEWPLVYFILLEKKYLVARQFFITRQVVKTLPSCQIPCKCLTKIHYIFVQSCGRDSIDTNEARLKHRLLYNEKFI